MKLRLRKHIKGPQALNQTNCELERAGIAAVKAHAAQRAADWEVRKFVKKMMANMAAEESRKARGGM